MTSGTGEKRILGLDLGATSIGWALLETDAKGEPCRIVDAGVRIFEAGVDGDIETGRDESRGGARRAARMARRQTDRRARRERKTALLLQSLGLLPEGNLHDPETRHQMLIALDADIRKRHVNTLPPTMPPMRWAQVFPYWLRAHALDHPLEKHELGRVLYHLAQRRGFKSNRKAAVKKDEEQGVVKSGIAEIKKAMQDWKMRTLGEFFANCDPMERRIRTRYTERSMYESEFDMILQAQAPHHPEILTGENCKLIRKALFHQRPLKSQKKLIGMCELEPNQRRAPLACLEAQRFRYLQKINDLRIIPPNFAWSDDDMNTFVFGDIETPDPTRGRLLTQEERAKLVDHLEYEGDIKFSALKKFFGLKKGYTFSHERGGEEKLVGNRTGAKMASAFGMDRWKAMSDDERKYVIDDVRSFSNPEALKNRAMRVYKLVEAKAEELADIAFEDDYCALSKKALRVLLPEMEQGVPFATARKKQYPEPEYCAEDLLPTLAASGLPEVRNPMVMRVMAELRKVMNALLRKYGKPDLIRIEMAREMRKNRKQRDAISKDNRSREKDRDVARKKIEEILGGKKPSRDDIEKYLLWEECNHECPYTGKNISMESLFGLNPQFDVEHIIPFSRCLDNTFLNKTLCYHEFNRTLKKNNTPFECFGGALEGDEFQAVLQRVERFKGDGRLAKLRRFRTQDVSEFRDEEDVPDYLLQDTSHAAKLSQAYLGILYGIDYRKHIEMTKGGVTALLRNVWGMNKMLHDSEFALPKEASGPKNRGDHRHHAVDAIAIALTSRSHIMRLSKAAEQDNLNAHRKPGSIPEPWPDFLDSVRATVDRIVVSHRVDAKVNGKMHQETFYGPKGVDDKGNPIVHFRKRVDALSANEIEAIANPNVRAAVKNRLAELGIADTKKAFASEANLPQLVTREGEVIPIRKVRLRKTMSTFAIGKGPRQRHVTNESNHHVEIIEVKDKKGVVKWEGRVVSQFEAMRRLKAGEPVINRTVKDGQRFVMSLCINENVEMLNVKGDRRLHRISGISEFGTGQIVLEFRDNHDARPVKFLSREGRTRSPNVLKQSEPRKLATTPIGEVYQAND